MKRKTLLILAVLLTAIACLFTSCSASVEPPKEEEEFGYVTFGNGGSRSLSTEYGIKSYDSLYWYYTAAKKDSFGLTGQKTEQTPVPAKTDDGKGIGSGTIRLSQGAWQFELFAYESARTGTPSDNLVYQGKSEIVVLKGGETKAVPISVSFKGSTGLINLSRAWFAWENGPNKPDATINVTIALSGKTDTGAILSTSTLLSSIPLDDAETNKYTLGGPLSIPQSGSTTSTTDIPAGYYTCTVRVYLGSDEVPSESTPVATQAFGLRVYGNATTYITDNIIESPDTYVEFTVPEQKVVAFNQSQASVALNPAGEKDENNDVLPTTVNFGNNLSSGASHILTVEVTDLEASGAKFEVTGDESSTQKTAVAGLSLTLNKVWDDNGITKQEEVTNFSSSDPVVITTYIAKGLENVQVMYNGSLHTAITSVLSTSASKPASNYYESDTGKLVFSTNHFSEYYAVADKFKAFNETKNTAYSTLENALAKVLEGDVIILGVGEYAPFSINTANVTIKGTVGTTKAESTVIKSTDTFDTSVLGSGNLTIKAEGVTIDSIWFDVTTKQEAGSWTTRGAFFADKNGATIKNCMIEGSGKNDGSYAALFYGENITITGCTFKNFERGIYHMGDSVSDPQFTITNNTFENVLVPFDTYVSQPLSSETADSYITITGNTVTGTGPSYIQVWDHAQWTKKNMTPGSNAGIKNVKLNNTGNIVYYLTHFNMLTENSGIEVTENAGQDVFYRSYVEVDASYLEGMTPTYNDKNQIVGYSGIVTHENGAEITEWNEHPFIRIDDSKYYIYTTVPGNYEIYTSSEKTTKVTDFTVYEQVTGTIQKIVAESKFTSFSTTVLKSETTSLTSGKSVQKEFNLKGVEFIFGVSDSSSFASDAIKMIITVTETDAENAEWEVAFSDSTKYYKIEIAGLATSGDPGWPNLYIKNATGVTRKNNASLNWSGFGYSAIISGYDGRYYLLGGLQPNSNV